MYIKYFILYFILYYTVYVTELNSLEYFIIIILFENVSTKFFLFHILSYPCDRVAVTMTLVSFNIVYNRNSRAYKGK